MQTFIDKVAVITGAASGIGRALAERSAREGMHVVLADIDERALGIAAQEIQTTGTQVLTIPTDVSRAADIEALAQQTVARFGGVHLLFNNAGVFRGFTSWETTEAEWKWVLGVNLWGVIHATRVFVPIMLAQQSDAHIVNTASSAGLIGGPHLGAYMVSKHGVVSLSETLYHELALRNTQLKVSVLCPNFVQTRLVDVEHHDQVGPSAPPPRQGEIEFLEDMRQAIMAGMSTTDLADYVFAAIRAEQFYILPHPEVKSWMRERMEDILNDRNPTLADV